MTSSAGLCKRPNRAEDLDFWRSAPYDHAMPKAKVVAVINTNQEVVLGISEHLSYAGYTAIIGHLTDIRTGRFDFVAWLQQHDPDAVIIDIPPPYDDNWRFVTLLRDLRSMQ